MTYLVTGGLGFIGSTFVKHILKEEPESRIVVLDALTYAGNLSNLEDYITDSNIIYPQLREELRSVVVNSDGSKLVGDITGIRENANRINQKLKGYNTQCPADRNVAAMIEDVLTGSCGSKPTNLVVVVGNIIDHELVDSIVSCCDTVVNFAAETHVDRSILNPDEFVKTDVYGTYVLLEAARKSKTLKKFLHISTDEVYGVATDKSFNESDPINPRNPYSASKAAADRLVYAYNQTYELPINIVRPSNNFGPNQYPEKLIPVMIIKALNGESLPVYGDGKQIRDWLFVEDTARAIRLVVYKGKPGEVYNIAGNNERENITVIRQILSKLGKSEDLINYVQDRPGHDRRYSLDDAKICSELGFTQTGDFERKLEYTIDWYLDNEDWWQKILREDQEYKKFMGEWYKTRK